MQLNLLAHLGIELYLREEEISEKYPNSKPMAISSPMNFPQTGIT